MNVDMWKSNAENSLRATELNMTNNDKGSGAQQLVIERNRQRMCARKYIRPEHFHMVTIYEIS